MSVYGPIVDATPGDAGALSALALEAKASWGYDEKFLLACRDELTYDANFVEHNIVRLIRYGQQLAGFYAITADGPDQLELDALFVQSNHQGKGLGSQLLIDAKHRARQCSAKSIVIQADPNAEAFYLAAGAKRIGSRPSASIPDRKLPLLVLSVQH